MIDGVFDISTSIMVALPSPNHISLPDIYFPKETDEHGAFIEPTDMIDEAIPHDEYID